MIAVIIITIVQGDLIIPFSDDPYSHTYLSLQPSLEILKLANKYDLIPIDQKVSSLLIIFNLLLFFGTITVLYLLKNKKVLLFILLSIFVILFRYINIKMGGGSSQHPPFRLFPMWATGTLGFLTTIGFRLQGIIPLLLITGTLYNKTQSYLKTAALVSIPLLLHTSTIVEYSIWYMAGSFLFLNRLDKTQDKDIIIDMMLVVLFALIRPPSILLLLFVIYKIIFLQQKKLNLRFIALLFVLILPAVLFIIGSIYEGNPALSHIAQTEINWAERLKTIYYLLFRDFGIIYSSFLLFYFYRNKHWPFIFIFVFSNILLFSSAHTLGVPRYQIEIFGAGILMGGFFLSRSISHPFPYIIMLIMNISIFQNKWATIKVNDYSNPIISERLYPYNEALNHINSLNGFPELYIAGYNYKGISLILNGSNVEEYIKYLNNFNKIGFNNIKAVNQNPIIKHLLIEDRLLDSASLIHFWTMKKVFMNPLSNESLYYYDRSG
ncbi:hypothetical protein OAK09_01950 [Candidatus Marinimicrobia bacterium]|nr:hypothetical protein [Candidatus Neomarinimicrobiota bacterium]